MSHEINAEAVGSSSSRRWLSKEPATRRCTSLARPANLDVVQELLKLMPKFAEKVDVDGFSPLHIAAARGDVEIARELLRVGRHLCSVKGRERRIPLHYDVVNGELHVMKLLLSAWPESIEETTAREETVLHLAAKKTGLTWSLCWWSI
ncbi:hypothetical protein NL676_009404 [Syzygium grande]|nr:hypothetical protein NL676_009404 [Syzygium grande]